MVAHNSRSAVMECIMLPSPVSGATIPPSRKGKDPSMAEAMPRCSLTELRASVMPTDENQ